MKRVALLLFLLIATLTVSYAQVKGRTIVGSLPKPSYTSQSEGVVVVQIKVDQYGTVVEAIPGAEGTTTKDKNLWNASRDAALKAHFNQSANAPAIQTGTLKYSFSLGDKSFLSNSYSANEYTPIKDLVDAQGHGVYSIRAKYVRPHKLEKLIFLVEEDDYIIPIQLRKNDLGAEKRFQSLNLQAGDSLTIRGTLSKIDVDFEDYTGLSDAVIEDVTAMYQSQDQSSESESDTVPYQYIEKKPSFNGGGANEFSKWVNEHLRYPRQAKDNGIQGRVTLQFTIKADGRVAEVHVIRGVDPDLDKEAVRVVSNSPKWTPGMTKGKPVDVIYTFPVIFQLR